MEAKFKIGIVYTSTCFFTGGTIYRKCVSRTEHTVSFSEVNDELDGMHNTGLQTYDIGLDNDGREYVTIYRYHDEENRVYATL